MKFAVRMDKGLKKYYGLAELENSSIKIHIVSTAVNEDINKELYYALLHTINKFYTIEYLDTSHTGRGGGRSKERAKYTEGQFYLREGENLYKKMLDEFPHLKKKIMEAKQKTRECSDRWKKEHPEKAKEFQKKYMKKYLKKNKNKCMDCGNKISLTSTRCRSCGAKNWQINKGEKK